MSGLLGRLHPALVHFPVGILLLCCFIHLFARSKKFAAVQAAVPLLLFWGMLSAILSAATGYLLSLTGEYDETLLTKHQWLGISVAVFSIVMYLLFRYSVRMIVTRSSAAILILLTGFTGHIGGSLTHGEAYLTGSFDEEKVKGPAIKPIANIQQAEVYSSAVQPLLEARCYGCHGATKMKGKLRLDKPDLIMKGGEDGKVIVAGRADQSPLIDRVMLPREHKDHMPPKEKTQLTKNESELLRWWVASGADFTKKFHELPQDKEIQPILLALASGADAEDAAIEIPQAEVKKPDEAAMRKLHDAGVMVLPVARGSNYLSVNFVTAYTINDSILKLLQPLSENIIWVNFAGTSIENADMPHISKFHALRKLNISNTNIGDTGIAHLAGLQELQQLNLVGTKVTGRGLEQLGGLKNLRTIYLYRSNVDKSEWAQLRARFPRVSIDSGGYQVPTLAQDTTEVKFN